MKTKIDRRWFMRILDFINPLRDPSLTVAAVLTFIEEAGQHDAWYWVIVFGLVNWLAVRGIVWLIVNFTFASTFISRRLWWAIRHPRLAWRILDAVGHEEIVIGGLPTIGEGVVLPDGTTIMSPALGASGIHVIGELPAGTEVPMLGMPDGTMVPDLSALASSGIFGNTGILPAQGMSGMIGMAGMAGTSGMYQNAQMSNSDFTSQPTTDNFPRAFPQRPSAEEERLRQQLAAYARLMDDWIQFTEEKWRTVSDSQLGWKPLRGRWGSWDDIFADAYAARTADPMAQAAQDAGDATSRRFDNSKEKGSAASAVACFLRDMMTLRRGLEMMQRQGEPMEASPADAAAQPTSSFTRSSGPLRGFGAAHSPAAGGSTLRGPLIRRPSQIFVDADTQK